MTVNSNELSLEEGKAHYTFEIAKQVIWPNEKSITSFTVVVISRDKAIIKAFNDKKDIAIRGKKVEISFFENSKFNTKPMLIFIGNKKRSLNKELYSKWKEALIITDGRVHKKEHMVSLITQHNDIKIRINRENLIARKLSPSTTLLNVAGTKEDLSKHLRFKEQRLFNLSEDVKESHRQLSELNNSLAQKSKDLNNAQLKLERNKKVLNEYQQQLKNLASQVET